VLISGNMPDANRKPLNVVIYSHSNHHMVVYNQIIATRNLPDKSFYIYKQHVTDIYITGIFIATLYAAKFYPEVSAMYADMTRNNLVRDFYIQHNSWLYQWLYKKVCSSFDAADLTQDTFARLRATVDTAQISDPRAYVTRIAHELIVRMLTHRYLERPYHESLPDPYEMDYPSPEIRAIALEALVAVDEMLNGLKPKVREAYLLMQLDGLKRAEIAQKLDISVKTVG